MRASAGAAGPWLLLLLLGCAAPAAAPARNAPPNVVLLYADDLGYGDVSCYNPERGKIRTPHIDRLAAGGMRFTDAHSSSGVCSPSRYALLTGRYHWRTRLQKGIVNLWGAPLIPPGRLTLASLARSAGYRTACVGKWHLGWDWPIEPGKQALFRLDPKAPAVTDAHRAAWRETFSKPIPGGPLDRGFDEYFGTDVPNWPPYCWIENDRTVGIPTEALPARLFQNHLASLNGPALPGWAFEPILSTLGDRACEFIARQGKSGRPFLLYLPFTSPHTPISPGPAWRGKSGLSPYADLVLETDHVVGRVLDALRGAGVEDRTLVILTSDNGCAPYIGVPEMEKAGHFPSGPLRGYKASAWEGGHRVPFVVRWPGVVPAGRVSDALVHQADVLATVAEILGATLPPDAGEDSFSLLPLLRGASAPVRSTAVSCSSAGVPAFRRGPWKLVLEADGAAPCRLFDLASDLGETRNLASERPDLVAELSALFRKTIENGRSTAGPPAPNDVRPAWRLP